MYKAIRQFLKFGLVGISNTVVGLTIYYLFIWIRNDIVMAMVGQAVGWFVSVANSFLWNRKFVFNESNEVWWRALLKMYAGYAFSILVSLMLTYIQVQWLNVSTIIAPLVNLIVTVPLNFFITKYWSFKNNRGE